ncbi:MAG: methyltransferase family protein [Rhodothalassiaceae bacterium]
MSLTEHLLYALLWLSFGAGHSVLARPSIKARLIPLLGRRYRLVYNLLALGHIALVLGLGRICLAAERVWLVPAGWPRLALAALSLAGLIVLILALRRYDLDDFSGLAHLKGRPPDAAPLQLSGLHARVRHPLYTGLFMLLWGQAVDAFGLATAIWGSLYLLIGTWLEERALVARFGAAYQDYRRRVPAFIPRLF